MKKALSLTLSILLILSLTACSTDSDYHYGKLQLELGNYQKAYGYLKESSDPRAEELLASLVYVPLTYTYKNDYTDTATEYTYDEDGNLIKVWKVNDYESNYNEEFYTYTYVDGICREYNYVQISKGAVQNDRIVTYDERGNQLYVRTVGSDTTDEVFYAYDANGNLLVQDERYIWNGDELNDIEGYELYDRQWYTYDEQGRPLTYVQDETYYRGSHVEEKYVYAEDGSYVVHATYSNDDEEQTNYDTQGRKIRERTKNKNSNRESLYEYTYDAAGNLVHEFHRYAFEDEEGVEQAITTTTSCSYNENGQLLSLKTTDKNGETTRKEEYTYDEAGHKIKEEISYDGLSWIFRTYTYDEEGKLLTEHHNGETIDTTTYSYNDDGTLKMTEKVGGSGTFVSAYTYDEHGNRVASLHQSMFASGYKRQVDATATWRLCYYPDGVPEEVAERIEHLTW